MALKELAAAYGARAKRLMHVVNRTRATQQGRYDEAKQQYIEEMNAKKQ